MTGKFAISLIAAALVGGCGGPPTPEKTVQQLMAEDVQPTAQVYWDAVQFISDETGNHDIFPKTDAEWKRTRDAATRIVELAELMQTPGYAEGRGKDWVQISQSLAEVGKLAEQAADSKDPDKVFEVGGTLYSVCSGCHQVYPPAEGLPPQTEAEAPPAG
jgi:hypothetical protein